jgi:hypothetical protein
MQEALRNTLCKTFDSLSRTGAAFLITDLAVAGTFLDVARSSFSEETQRRNHKNARRAYDSVLTLLPKVKVNEAELQTINKKLALVKERLKAVGERF